MALERVFNRNIGFNARSPRLRGPVQDWRFRGPIPEAGLIPGSAACPGCGESAAIKLAIQATKAAQRIPVLAISTGCPSVFGLPGFAPPLELIKELGRLSPAQLGERGAEFIALAGRDHFDCATITENFESVAALADGLCLVRNIYEEDGIIPPDLYKILVWGGDGAIEDIGFGALLGAADRGADITVIEGINRTYANTGGQRVGARTYRGSNVAFAPWGKHARGKLEGEKDIMEVLLANGFQYVAFASPVMPHDLIAKIQKAALIKGPAYVGVSSFCPQVQGAPAQDCLRSPRLELDARLFWIAEAEVVPGANSALYTLNYAPDRFVPVGDFFGTQKLYRELVRDPELIAEHQARVDLNWRFWNPVFGANGLPVIAAPAGEVA